MGVRNVFRRIYFRESRLSKKDYYTSRGLFIFEGCSAAAILSLTSGAFLAGYAQYLGASDQLNGIIAAIPTLAGVIQLLSPILLEKMAKRKLLVSALCLAFRLMLGAMVFIPLIVQNRLPRTVLLITMYLSAYLMSSFITPAASNWIISLTPSRIRGKYFGRKDSYSLAFVAVVTLVMGKVLDIFKHGGNPYMGFVCVFTVVTVLALVNFFFLSSIKEPPVVANDVPQDIKRVLTEPLKDRKFRKVVILSILWNIGLQIGGPFFGVYLVTGLKLQYTYIMIYTMISSAASVLMVRVWGRLADKKSWSFTTKMSIGLLAVTHSLWFFVNTDTVYLLVPLLHIMSGAAWAGINISIFNIQFNFAPEKGRTVYIGFNAALGGIFGFLTAFVGSFIVGRLEGHTASILGFTIGNMQTVFGLSGILLCVCAVFIHYCIPAQK